MPLAELISDPDNAVQLEAIAAELNIFLGRQSVTDVASASSRSRIAQRRAAQRGLRCRAARASARRRSRRRCCRAAARDARRLAEGRLEALYAFGALASQEPGGAARSAAASPADVTAHAQPARSRACGSRPSG